MMTSAVKENKHRKRGREQDWRRGKWYRFWRQEGSRQRNGVFKGPEVVAHLVRIQIRARGLWACVVGEPSKGGWEREIWAEKRQGAGRALWAMGSTLAFL